MCGTKNSNVRNFPSLPTDRGPLEACRYDLLPSTLFCETRVMVVSSCWPGFVSLDQLLKSQGLHRPSGGHSLIEKVNNETMAKHTIV